MSSDKAQLSDDAVEAITRILESDSLSVRNDIHTWEQALEKTWDNIQEDPSGRLATLPPLVTQLATKRETDKSVIEARGTREGVLQKGLVRALCVCLDMSDAALDRDMRPTRGDVMSDCMRNFVQAYFDQNPVCTMALLACTRAHTKTLSPLGGAPQTHLAALAEGVDAGGAFSLESTLHTCVNILASASPHCSREVLLVTPSLTTLDAHDIEQSLQLCLQHNVRVSVVGLNARVYIFQRLCQLTSGVYTVADGPDRLRSQVLAHVSPLPASAEAVAAPQALTAMGFPALAPLEQRPCACHLQPLAEGYVCTQCGAAVCQLPCSCPVCGITLVSAPHLARSYHHLFHVPLGAVASTERYRWLHGRAQPMTKGADTNTTAAQMDAAQRRSMLMDEDFSSVLHATRPISSFDECERVICAGCDAPMVLSPERAVRWGRDVLVAEEAREKARGRELNVMELNISAGVPRGCEWWKDTSLGSLCTLCGSVVCVDCDQIIHTALHNCPGCLSAPRS